jgi:glycosyltransferase involved in cell wall biosynthesis
MEVDMKVAIFTTFLSSDHAYSLNNVVVDQIKMFKRAGYDPVVLVGEGFQPVGVYGQVELRYIPKVFLSNEGKLPDNYHEDGEKMTVALRELLKDINVCITHDVIYQPAHLIHNLASRKIADERADLRWLHWIHSATTPNILCNKDEVRMLIKRPFPHAFICYPNTYDRPRVANNFRYDEHLVKYVPHPIDIPEYLGFHEYTKEFVDKYNLIQTDIIMVYPVRLDRGKQVEMNIRCMAGLKRRGKTVRLIVADFHSTGGDKVVYRDKLKERAKGLGLSEQEVVFTSDFKPETKGSCPREMIRDLFNISNVFLLPSRSETYSLIAQEASICGNLLLLNFDFPPMRSIYGDNAIYLKFSSNVDALTGLDGETTTEYKGGEKYFDDAAKAICYELDNNRVVAVRDKLRKERNLDTVFKEHLEPLLYGLEKELIKNEV